MSFLFVFFIIFFIAYYEILKKSQNQIFNEDALSTLFKAQNFHDIENDTSIPEITITYANSHGENYLFAQKTSIIPFSSIDIDNIYALAQESHIHNIVILHSPALLSNSILNKIKEYDIQIWDQNKINSLIYSPSTNSILSTSDTSDDKCKIDTEQFNPIQEPSSFWNNIFKKPDRL